MICQYRDIRLTIKRKAKMQNWPSNFHNFSFQFSNFQFCQFSLLTFNFCQFKTLLQICYCCRYTHQNDAVLHVVFFFFRKKKKHLVESKRLPLNQNKKKRISIPNFERERERERESKLVWERERDWGCHPCSPCKPPRCSVLTELVMGVLCLALP